MTSSTPTTPLQFALAWRDAKAKGDTAEANAALAGAARALDADTLARAQSKIAKAAARATETGDPGPLIDAWPAMDRDERAAILATEEAPRERPPMLTIDEAAEMGEPIRLLSAGGEDGGVAFLGEVCVLSGPGNVGKSTLMGEVALAVADPDAPALRHAGTGHTGGLLDVHKSGSVLWLTFEENPGWMAKRLKALAKPDRTDREKALKRIRIVPMRGCRLFGPGDRRGAAGLYTARPEKLEGWAEMTRRVEELASKGGPEKPAMVIIDPLLSAYVGEPNAAPPVKEFLDELALWADRYELGVIALAHSTKAARKGDVDPFDPEQVAGTGQWVDGCRGAMTLTYDPEGEAGERMLAIVKANMGPAGIIRTAAPRRLDKWILGFTARDGWMTEREFAAARPSARADDPAADQCSARTKNGSRCTLNAVKDGLCKTHWRQREANGGTTEAEADKPLGAPA